MGAMREWVARLAGRPRTGGGARRPPSRPPTPQQAVDPVELDRSIAIGRATAADPAADLRELMIFAEALAARYALTAGAADLDDAITAARRVQQGLPADHPRRVEVTARLRHWVWGRHLLRPAPGDLDETIDLTRLLVAARPTSDVLPELLDVLAVHLSTRYERAGAVTDLEDALAASRRAVNKTAVDDPAWAGRAANLALILRANYLRTEDPAHLDLAVMTAEQALKRLRPGHGDHGSVRSNLGAMLSARFSLSADQKDLDESIRLFREAVAHSHDDPLGRAIPLSNLANALHKRFVATGSDPDLDEAVVLARRAVDATPSHEPGLGRHLACLGNVLLSRHERDGDAADLAEVITVHRSVVALPTATPSLRMSAALSAAAMAEPRGDVDAALAALHAAVDLLPVVAWHGLDRPSRESALGAVRGLAGEAAAAALRMDRPEHAVELLEQGTSVLWGQRLRLRTDLSELAFTAPGLADRLHSARQGLDGDAVDGSERTRLGRLWDETVREVRRLPGRADFQAPLPADRLLGAADEGPVVWLNATDLRCDALVLADGRVTVVPLTGLTSQSLLERGNVYLEALSWAAQSRGPEDFLVRERFRSELVDMLGWLWDTVTEPVLDALGFTGRSAGAGRAGDSGGPLPRLWWCPTGVLTFLPLHAAGHYGPGADRTRSVPGRVVSSYASGPGALLRSRRPGDRAAPVRVLAVGAVGGDGGQPALPEVRREIDGIAARVPAGRLTVLTGPQATRGAALRALRDHSWLHLAGHTRNDPERPLRTGIILSDGPLTALDLADHHLDDAQLAYLSACTTTLGSSRLTDEALHLPAVLQLVGFRHVIATQWHIEDRHAARIAEAVYSRLAEGGELDAGGAARALHGALGELREQGHPLDWAAYVHRGP